MAAFLFLNDDRQALADLQRQNEGRREMLSARDRDLSTPISQPGSPNPGSATAHPSEAAAAQVHTRDLIKRIDRLSEKLSSLERAALELDRRIVLSKLEAPIEPAKNQRQSLQEMAEELEARHQQCLGLFAKVRALAAVANAEIGDDVWLDPKPQIPAGLEKTNSLWRHGPPRCKTTTSSICSMTVTRRRSLACR